MNKYQEALDKLSFYSGLGLIDENTPQREERWKEFEKAKNMIQELVDKEKPMKPVLYKVNEYDDHFHKCPKCGCEIGHHILKSTLFKYCNECGQRLDWSDK